MISALTNIIRRSINALSKAGVDNPALDARLLIAHTLGCDRAQLVADANRTLSNDEVAKIDALIERRSQREPVSRIVGEREFWGLPFSLNEATLDPRADSETIIEVALKLMPSPPARILDIGTGTGCLLLALLHEYKNATGVGVDISPRAVEMAAQNAEQLNLAGKAKFIVNDGLNGVNEKFDLIVSNPPYIETSVIPSLMPEVKDFDPVAALDGGKTGLDFYQRLIPQLAQHLNAQGLAVFEVGQGQADSVCEIFKSAGLTNVAKHKDLSGIERCVSGNL